MKKPRHFISIHPVVELIAELRGGFPEKCDFCSQERTPDELVPDEGGEWSCVYCWERWDAEDKHDADL